LIDLRPLAHTEGQLQPRLPAHVLFLDLHQRQAEEGGLDIVAVALPGLVRETKPSRKRDAPDAQATPSADDGRVDDGNLFAVELAEEPLHRDRQPLRQGNRIRRRSRLFQGRKGAGLGEQSQPA